jgi:hypothetical protein
VGAQSERPLLHESERKLRRTLVAVGAGLIVVAAILVLVGFMGLVSSGDANWEIYKLLLQFFLITGGGGVLLALVGNVRDEAIRRQARAAAVYELGRELDRAYRALKKTKRNLRAYRNHAETPGKIPRAAFEKAMQDLLEAQLELEVICDNIGNRDDVLYRWRLDRMKVPLRYASRYYHDVHEDFERARVVLQDGFYDIAAAPNLSDFLRSSREVSGPRPGCFDEALDTLADGATSMIARYKALKAIVAAKPKRNVPGPDGRYDTICYADVAGACLDLLSAELVEARTNILS